MELQLLADTLHPLERKVLPHLSETTVFEDLVTLSGLKDVEVMRALQWLQNKGVIILHETIKEVVSLDKNGELYFKIGLPEKRFLEVIDSKKDTTLISVIQKKADLNDQEINICVGLLKRQNLISLHQGKVLEVSITPTGEEARKKGLALEIFLSTLSKPREMSSLLKSELQQVNEIKKRQNLIKTDIKRLKSFSLTEVGKKLTTIKLDSDVIEAVTHTLLKDSTIENRKFRRYDVEINVPSICASAGRRHFVNEAVQYVKHIWLDMGFQEMTGNMVHTSFWNLDALFIPQDHPARAMQDTFYLGNKSINKNITHGELPETYKKVQEAHEHGGNTGSTGWKTAWSPDEAKQLLLRTHTTVLSALKLNELKQEDLPAKFFSVGKVFRNEALDWKHLFEFDQVEGIVVDPHANFKHLKGYLRQFFKKMGYPDVRIRPAHFPYTEPSVEVDVLHPIKKEWVELGGAGIFRPEVVVPLLGKDIPVLAWGLGMGRIISEYYSITDIRDLYKNDLKQLREMKLWTRGILT